TQRSAIDEFSTIVPGPILQFVPIEVSPTRWVAGYSGVDTDLGTGIDERRGWINDGDAREHVLCSQSLPHDPFRMCELHAVVDPAYFVRLFCDNRNRGLPFAMCDRGEGGEIALAIWRWRDATDT